MGRRSERERQKDEAPLASEEYVQRIPHEEERTHPEDDLSSDPPSALESNAWIEK